MFTENGLMIDLGEVRKVVDHCDVFTIGFRLFPQRLLTDTRHSGEEGPFIGVVEPVATVEERFFWLGQKRPRFGAPQRFAFFVWPHSIAFLEECGVVERIGQRLTLPEWPDALGSCRQAIAELKRLESQAALDAISGRNYHTLWPRS